jgi:hypothetical protein
MISTSHNTTQTRNQEIGRILNEAKADLANERLINGRLRASVNLTHVQQNSTPHTKNQEKENQQYVKKIQILTDQLKEAEGLKTALQQEVVNLKGQLHLKDSCPSNCKTQKRKHHEMEQHVNLTAELMYLFHIIFSLTQDNNQSLEENMLYDAFLSSVHESQRLYCFGHILY